VPGRGFTLIELLAVVVLLSVITAGFAFTLKRPLSRGRVSSDISRMIFIDRVMRSEARRFSRPSRLTFHVDRDGAEGAELRRGFPKENRNRRVLSLRSLIEVRTAQQQSGETVTIDVDSSGATQTYAMRFRGPASHSATWLLIVGGSGQVVLDLDQSAVDNVFREISGETTPSLSK